MPLVIKATVSESERHLKEIWALLFYNNKLYSSAEDGIIKVWHPDLKLAREFQAHQSVVYHLAAINDTLYTCSNDGTIQAWNVDTFEHKKTLLQYDEEPTRLFVSNGNLFSGDNKGIVSSWENDEIKLMYNLLEEVRDLAVEGNLLYTVRDRDVIVTELMAGEKGRYMTRKTLEGSSPLCIVGKKLCFATRSAKDICVHENTKESLFKELAQIQAHDMIINALCGAGDSTLYSGGYDKKVKQWSLDTYQCTASYDVGCCVNALSVGSEGQVYAGGPDGFICRLDK